MRAAAIIAGVLILCSGCGAEVYYCRTGVATKQETGEKINVYMCSPSLEEVAPTP